MKKIKVCFCDVDGVLNVIPEGFDDFGAIYHKHFMANLKEIVDETDAKIVISSSLRTNGLKFFQDMWKFRGYAGEIIDVTPTIHFGRVYFWNGNDNSNSNKLQDIKYGSIPRGCEIDYWLNFESKNFGEVTNYVILDDDLDMLLEQKDNFVKCSDNSSHPDCIDIGFGLTQICTDNAIKILNK